MRKLVGIPLAARIVGASGEFGCAGRDTTEDVQRNEYADDQRHQNAAFRSIDSLRRGRSRRYSETNLCCARFFAHRFSISTAAENAIAK